jgi:hypothetical protein
MTVKLCAVTWLHHRDHLFSHSWHQIQNLIFEFGYKYDVVPSNGGFDTWKEANNSEFKMRHNKKERIAEASAT